jgi:hypothetical protein
MKFRSFLPMILTLVAAFFLTEAKSFAAKPINCSCYTAADFQNAESISEDSTFFVIELANNAGVRALFVAAPFLNRGVLCEQEICDAGGNCTLNLFPLDDDGVEQCLILANQSCPTVNPDTFACEPYPTP